MWMSNIGDVEGKLLHLLIESIRDPLHSLFFVVFF